MDIVGIFDATRGRITRDIIEHDVQPNPEQHAEASVAAFNRALVELEQAAWQRGFDLASGIMARQRDEDAELLLQVSARMRGKDRADGYVTTTVYPDPAIYDWRA